MQVKLGPNDISGVRHANWTFASNTSDTDLHGSNGIYIPNMDGITAPACSRSPPGSAGVVFELDDVCGVNLGVNDFLNWQTLY